MLPIDFIDNMSNQLGGELDAFCQALSEPAVVSIRLNDKLPKQQLDVMAYTSPSERIPWTDDGYYLSERPRFTLDPMLHAGCYYVQDAS